MVSVLYHRPPSEPPLWLGRRRSSKRWCYYVLCLLIPLIFAVQQCLYSMLQNKQLFVRHHTGNHCFYGDWHDCWLHYWMGYNLNLPMHMQKDSTLLHSKQTTHTNVCFVHVGKTAGTTVECYLGFLKMDCFATQHARKHPTPIAPGLLPRSTTHKIHDDRNDCNGEIFDYHLFVVRHPLQRLQSWFTYERPDDIAKAPKSHAWRRPMQERLFVDCHFHTLNELGEYGLVAGVGDDHPTGSSSAMGQRQSHHKEDSLAFLTEDEITFLGGPQHYQMALARHYQNNVCVFRAHAAVRGWIGYSTHNLYNYQYYLEVAQSTSSTNHPIQIVVIRTEHLYDDWKSIEEDVLQGDKNLNVTFGRKNASPKNTADTVLSQLATTRLCRALCEEIQAYKEILQRAVNLNIRTVDQSLNDLAVSCPMEVARETC